MGLMAERHGSGQSAGDPAQVVHTDQADEDAVQHAVYTREKLQTAALASSHATSAAQVLHKLAVVLRRLSEGTDGSGNLCAFEAQTLQLAVSANADVAEMLHGRQMD